MLMLLVLIVENTKGTISLDSMACETFLLVYYHRTRIDVFSLYSTSRVVEARSDLRFSLFYVES